MMAGEVDILESHDGALLVQMARASLEQFVWRGVVPRPYLAQLPTAVQQPGATFVTLRYAGRLRGCIGNVLEERSLAESVVYNAVAAASRDPRFPPVTTVELAQMSVEVTVLTPLCPLLYTQYDDLLSKIESGRDGVMFRWGKRRGILLPQMWERIPTTADFLKAIAQKANIPHTHLLMQPPAVAVYTFQAQHFIE
jgi:AmmeMemoRadiSam system protein A